MKKIGLVLGGGGARGLAHVGFLKQLEKAQIPISAISGCSMGSIIGTFYAAGKSATDIEKFILDTRTYDLMDISPTIKGFSKAEKIQKKIEEFIGITKFSELKIPLTINATDFSTGTEKVFSEGSLIKAIRASISFPVLFQPVKIGSKFYSDGGIINNLPFAHLPKSINKIILVDVSPPEKINNEKTNMVQLLETSVRLMQNQINKLNLEKIKKEKYILIKPNVGKYHVIEPKTKFKEIILKGENSFKRNKKEILRMITK
ncbi:Patatin [Candidatus Woesearchaeota archaeon]|jgi:NTE family protein|nr:Patatin [Candidatus Woesearchaeota archaeon]